MRGVHRDVTPQIQPRFSSTLLCGQASGKRVTKGQAHALPRAGRRETVFRPKDRAGVHASCPGPCRPAAGRFQAFWRRLRSQSCSFCRKSLVECLGCRLPARPSEGLSAPKGLARRAVRACLSRILHLFFTSSGIQAQPSFFAHALCTAPWGSLLPRQRSGLFRCAPFCAQGQAALSVHPKPVWDAKDLSSWIVSGMLFCSA